MDRYLEQTFEQMIAAYPARTLLRAAASDSYDAESRRLILQELNERQVEGKLDDQLDADQIGLLQRLNTKAEKARRARKST